MRYLLGLQFLANMLWSRLIETVVLHSPLIRSGWGFVYFVHANRNEGQKMEKIPMTIAGHEAMEMELKRRKTVDRPSIVNAISEARKHGDLSENAEYHAAKEEQGLNEAAIQMLESNLALAEVIDVSTLSGDRIIFGATVKLVDEDTDEEATYQIVGESEADVKLGKISISSPIARALINKQVEDSAEVNTPGGGKTYEVLGISFI